MIQFILNRWVKYHVSSDTVKEFEDCVKLSDSIITINNKKINSEFAFFIYRVLRKLKLLTLLKPILNLTKGNAVYFVILMGPDFRLSLPFFFLNGQKNVYLFDAWTYTHSSILQYAETLKIKNIFLSSSEAVENLKKYNSKCDFYWIPEGIDPAKYFFKEYSEKDIDVIQIGRKYDSYHDRILCCLNKENRVYFYEKKKGEIIFPFRKDFLDGLARSKVSICFPSNITHPERAAGIETMTVRYLQSIASKCLIVGKAPRGMIKLFGYNPVIDADMKNPEEQLLSILHNYEKYHSLIEQNLNSLINHTWIIRWKQIKEIIGRNLIYSRIF